MIIKRIDEHSKRGSETQLSKSSLNCSYTVRQVEIDELRLIALRDAELSECVLSPGLETQPHTGCTLSQVRCIGQGHTGSIMHTHTEATEGMSMWV